MDIIDKYGRFVPFILSQLTEKVVDSFDKLNTIKPQVFMFKDSSNDDYAIYPLSADLLSSSDPNTWHTLVSAVYHLGFEDEAEGYIVVAPVKSASQEPCLIYTFFNVKLQEGVCLAHSLSSEETIEIYTGECSDIGEGFELLFTPQH